MVTVHVLRNGRALHVDTPPYAITSVLVMYIRHIQRISIFECVDARECITQNKFFVDVDVAENVVSELMVNITLNMLLSEALNFHSSSQILLV